MKHCFIATLAMVLLFTFAGLAQTTVFTYQGQLVSNNVPANGLFDLRFELFDVNTNLVAGPLTNSPTGVTNGSFLVDLNFGGAVFNGSDRWLGIAVRDYGDTNTYSALSPLQQITSSPYAIRALNAGNASNAVSLVAPLEGTNIIGTIPGTNLPPDVAFLDSNQVFTASNTFNGVVTAGNAANSFAGVGAGLTSLTAGNLTGTVPDARLSPNVALLTNPANPNLVFSASITATNFIGAGHGLTNVPGAFFWVTLTSTNAQAFPNVGYICTNNLYPVFITLPASPSVGDVFRVAGVGDGGWIIVQNTGQSILGGNLANSAGVKWTARTGNNAWAGIASSADGSRMAACLGSGGQINLSSNSGASWVNSGSPSANWSSVASSADGSKLVAGVNGGLLYTNGNFGMGAWGSKLSSQSWVSVASSSDGTKLIAAAYGTSGTGPGIYTSTNSGATWSQVESGVYYCSAVACSANGAKDVFAVTSSQSSSGIYTSSNSGVAGSWTLATNMSTVTALACSADGSRLVAAATPSSSSQMQLYVSSNGGSTWSANGPSGMWTAVACSADGSRMSAVGSDGSVYISSDSGTTWIQSAVFPSNLSWAGATLSANGSVMAITASGGPIYTSGQGSTTTGANGYLFGVQQATIELNYVGNGVFIPLSHEGNILAY
jgi:hypothetical protein